MLFPILTSFIDIVKDILVTKYEVYPKVILKNKCILCISVRYMVQYKYNRKFSENIHSKYKKNNTVEYLSRGARRQIVESLCRYFLGEELKKRDMGVVRNTRGRPPISGITILSSMLGVSRKSVGRWIAGEMQSSNVNAERLLKLALDVIPEVLRNILYEDLTCHRFEIEGLLSGIGVEA